MFQRGQRVDGRHLQLIAAAAVCRPGRVGFIIPAKQLRRAVDRNLLRRVLREAVHGRRPDAERFDIILRLSRACARRGLRELAREAGELIDALVKPEIR